MRWKWPYTWDKSPYIRDLNKYTQQKTHVYRVIILKRMANHRRGATEHIFTLRNILEQCNEWQRDIYVNVLDFEKAFDSVHRTSLWKILRQYRIPQKIVNVITLFYNNFTCCVQNSSSSFAVESGVHQGSVMSSFLFILIIDWIMKNGTEQERTGIRWTPLGMSQNAKLRHSCASVTICPLKFSDCAKTVSHHKNFWCVKFKMLFWTFLYIFPSLDKVTINDEINLLSIKYKKHQLKLICQYRTLYRRDRKRL